MTILYYAITMVSGTPFVTVVEKTFWNQYHAADYGNVGPKCHDIADAMMSAGAYEEMESVFSMDNQNDIWNIIPKMREAGYDMQVNEAFTKYVACKN